MVHECSFEVLVSGGITLTTSARITTSNLQRFHVGDDTVVFVFISVLIIVIIIIILCFPHVSSSVIN